ncbi:MAG: MBL fold metallo-hydrolase [Acidobacteriaceae bacterium]|nr:MBL fold metallo-hydrolase [Acidobacteriaceae bacterium]
MRPTRDQFSFLPHFDGKRFFNPGGKQARGLLDVLRWKLTSRAAKSPAFIDDVQPSIPVRSLPEQKIRVTLVNHSTALLQAHGLNILTDPVWSERASPFPFMGPRRHRAPGVRFEDLPPIDLVLLSHNHYDHLDLSTLRQLKRNHQSEYVVPLGLAKLLSKHKLPAAHEIDWGDSLTLRGITIHAVPALHFSARGLGDRNRTLWCGYLLETAGGLIYYAGDTAHGEHFAAIHKLYEPPRVALLPVGAYQPRWFMSAVHMDPEEAVSAHQVLGAQVSIAIHHGTFQLTDEALDTPRRELESCIRKAGVDPKCFQILQNGQFADFQ